MITSFQWISLNLLLRVFIGKSRNLWYWWVLSRILSSPISAYKLLCFTIIFIASTRDKGLCISRAGQQSKVNDHKFQIFIVSAVCVDLNDFSEFTLMLVLQLLWLQGLIAEDYDPLLTFAGAWHWLCCWRSGGLVNNWKFSISSAQKQPSLSRSV